MKIYDLNGQITELTQAQYDQALRDSQHCRCDGVNCLACTVYWHARNKNHAPTVTAFLNEAPDRRGTIIDEEV
jgi:hypothetical protein